MARATIRTTQQANEQLRKSNPELFVSRLLLARKIESDLREQGSFDRKKIPRIARDNSRTQFKELQARRKDSVQRLLRPFNREEEARIKKERRIKTRAEAQERARSADRRRDPRVATPQAEIDRQKVTRPTTTRTRRRITREGELTREQRDNLSRGEAESLTEAAANPETQGVLDDVKSFTKDLSPADEAEFTKQAEALGAEFFEEEREFETRDLRRKIRDLNKEFGFLTEAEELSLERKLLTADRETASALSQTIDNLQSRGILNSGALKRFADEIIEARAITIDFATRLSDLSLRRGGFAQESGIEAAEFGTERALLKIRREQKEDIQSGAARLAALESARRLRAQEGVGGTEPREAALPGEAEVSPEDVDIRFRTRELLQESQVRIALSDPGAERISQISPRATPSVAANTRGRSFQTLPEIRGQSGRTQGRVSARTQPGTTLQERSRLRGLARSSR